MSRFLVVLLLTLLLAGCVMEEPAVCPFNDNSAYVYTDANQGKEEVPPDFLVLNAQGKCVDKRNGHILKRVPMPRAVSEEGLATESDAEAQRNLIHKFDSYPASKPYNGRAIKPKPPAKKKQSPKNDAAKKEQAAD